MSEEKKTWKRHLDVDILPILVITKTSPAKILSYEGTGFLIAPNLFITCWHCVRKTLEENQTYAVCREQKDELFPLMNIQQDSNKTDLATANVAMMPEAELSLAEKDVFEGTDVHSFGYPLLNFEVIQETGERIAALDFRLLRGYITRNFWRDDQIFGRGNAYELDMPTPEGLSGSPLFKSGSRGVLGVIFGQNEVALITSFAKVDPETNEREPEIQKVYHFGLAHNTETLRNLKTDATRNLPLHEYLNEDFSKRKDSYHFYVRGKLLLDNLPFEISCKCGFANKIEPPFEKLYCSWCVSNFKFTGVMDGVALVSKEGNLIKVIGTDKGVAIADDGQGLMIVESKQDKKENEPWKIVNIIGRETALESANKGNSYCFYIKTELVNSNKAIALNCKCGGITNWLPPHDELKCNNCSASFVFFELEGEGTHVSTSAGLVKVINS